MKQDGASAIRSNLRRLLKPKSVAFIGGRTLGPSVDMLRLAGFKGSIHVVNPFQAEIAGIRCTPAVDQLSEAPDASFINVNRYETIKVVEQLDGIKAGGAVCFAAGFSEMGEGGSTLQAELIKACGDLALVGPNSNGLINRLDGLALWPIADHEPSELDRGVAIISQSGGIANAFLRTQRGITPAIIASIGNQAQLSAGDWLAVLAEDPRVTAIGMYLEGPGNVSALAEAAEATTAHQKPVLVLKSGRSEVGAKMALTHSGSMAGEDDLFNALCDHLGFIRVKNLPELFEGLKAVHVWGRRIQGNRMGVVTASGAVRALIADAAEDVGIALPELAASTVAALRPQLPEFAHVSNPLDHNAHYTGLDRLSMENEAALFTCFETMLTEKFDIAVLETDGGTESGGNPSLRAWIRATQDAKTPAAIVSTLPERISSSVHEICDQGGIASLQGIEDAVSAIAMALRHGMRGATDGAERFEFLPPVPVANAMMRNEWDSKIILESAGIPFPKRVIAHGADVAAAAANIGYPVVLKAVSNEFPHKARAGLVSLGLSDQASVAVALERMRVTLARSKCGEGAFLIEKMIEDSVAEIFIGVKTSRLYGQALIIGRGGVDVEHNSDRSIVLLPAPPQEIEAAVAKLKISTSFSEDQRRHVCDIASSVAKFAVLSRSTLVSLDINPVIVRRAGTPIAVDALIEMGDPK